MDTAKAELPSEAFYAELTQCLPHMRSFARFLCRRDDLADDLVQDAVVRASMAAHQFNPGTNFKAWIFTIMHNLNISNYRRRRPVVVSSELVDNSLCQIAPNQIDALILQDLERAIRKLPLAQRKALILVVVHGLSYEDAAQVCQCAVGTVKSRVGRARAALHAMLLGQSGRTGARGESGVTTTRDPVNEDADTMSAIADRTNGDAQAAGTPRRILKQGSGDKSRYHAESAHFSRS